MWCNPISVRWLVGQLMVWRTSSQLTLWIPHERVYMLRNSIKSLSFTPKNIISLLSDAALVGYSSLTEDGNLTETSHNNSIGLLYENPKVFLTNWRVWGEKIDTWKEREEKKVVDFLHYFITTAINYYTQIPFLHGWRRLKLKENVLCPNSSFVKRNKTQFDTTREFENERNKRWLKSCREQVNINIEGKASEKIYEEWIEVFVFLNPKNTSTKIPDSTTQHASAAAWRALDRNSINNLMKIFHSQFSLCFFVLIRF